ncbi:MAG: membrane dipeptidase [Ruminococcaceae bacterium]|nr:membrane dipeptidase [Oscillospiraceae bacterium]
MHDYKIFDAHCDTLTTLRDSEFIRDTDRHFNLKQAEEYAGYTQVMALWTDIGALKKQDSVDWKVERYVEIFNKIAAENPSFGIIKTSSDVMDSRYTHKLMLAIEGGEAIGTDVSGVSRLYDMGVRAIALTWNTPYLISDTNCRQIPGNERGGLTEFGFKVVKEMDSLGMVVDVSHISEKGFYDVADTTVNPFIASHSNAKALSPHPRNLTDQQFEVLIEKGGVTGINLYSAFLTDDGSRATIDTIIAHIEHFAALGGIDNIGIGTDFDGIDLPPEGISGARDLYRILNRLGKMNYTQEQIDKISHKNMERVFTEVLK